MVGSSLVLRERSRRAQSLEFATTAVRCCGGKAAARSTTKDCCNENACAVSVLMLDTRTSIPSGTTPLVLNDQPLDKDVKVELRLEGFKKKRKRIKWKGETKVSVNVKMRSDEGSDEDGDDGGPADGGKDGAKDNDKSPTKEPTKEPAKDAEKAPAEG